jgi:hypothetical protein
VHPVHGLVLPGRGFLRKDFSVALQTLFVRHRCGILVQFDQVPFGCRRPGSDQQQTAYYESFFHPPSLLHYY